LRDPSSEAPQRPSLCGELPVPEGHRSTPSGTLGSEYSEMMVGRTSV
jgi:hypothetical protein